VINYTPFIKRVQKNFELEQLKKVGEFTQGSPLIKREVLHPAVKKRLGSNSINLIPSPSISTINYQALLGVALSLAFLAPLFALLAHFPFSV
jgi:hypothetical protein